MRGETETTLKEASSEQSELARCAIHREVVYYRADTLTCDSEMELPSETPVALVYNGIAHSVMICSASDLEDLAIGFSLSEGIIDSLLDIHDIEQINGCQVIELHITLCQPLRPSSQREAAHPGGEHRVRHLRQRESGAGDPHPAKAARQPASGGGPYRQGADGAAPAPVAGSAHRRHPCHGASGW